jgi:NTE family protein
MTDDAAPDEPESARGTSDSAGGRSEKVAFVLGGGGLRGAAEVGMIKALAATNVTPDIVVGTSIGSINGVIAASGPLDQMANQLEGMWSHLESSGVLSDGLMTRMANLVRHRTHMHSNTAMRELLLEWLPYHDFEQLPTSFQCSAACIETSAERWFDSGTLIDAILASCAVPGLLPPVEVDGQHFIDGGVVNSIPISRALHLGATTIYVLHVGNIDTELRLPKNAWDVAFVAFEIARRHRFHHDMEHLPDDIAIHILPTGVDPDAKYNDTAKLRYNHSASIRLSIDRAYKETMQYLSSPTG